MPPARRRTSCRSGSSPTCAASIPGYEQKHFDDASKRGTLRLIASPDGRDGSVTIHADASIAAALLDGAESVVRDLDAGAQGLRAGRSRQRRRQRPAPLGRRRRRAERREDRSASRTATTPRCWSSTSPESRLLHVHFTHQLIEAHHANPLSKLDRSRRPDPARPDLHPLGFRQDRRLRGHRRLHRLGASAAADAGRGADDPDRTRRRPRARHRLLHPADGGRSRRLHRARRLHLPRLLGRSRRPSR